MATQEIWNELNLTLVMTKLKSRLMEEAFPGIGVFAHFARDYGYDDEDFDPRSDQDVMAQFEAFLDEKAHEVVRDQIDRLTYDVNSENGLVNIYRAIVVSSEWSIGDLASCPLGVCWSWDEQFAISYLGGGSSDDSNDVRLAGTVAVADVDWELTVALNAANEYWGEDEREIRLRDDATVAIHQVDARPFGDGEYRILGNLEGQTFPAEQAVVNELSL